LSSTSLHFFLCSHLPSPFSASLFCLRSLLLFLYLPGSLSSPTTLLPSHLPALTFLQLLEVLSEERLRVESWGPQALCWWVWSRKD
jgi:hypothetical protein